MSIVFLTNPRSGRGLALKCSKRFEAALASAGFETATFSLDPDAPRELPPRALDDARALVVFGGDGTIHHIARTAMATHTPLYHVPLGTENLFAREFGMSKRPRQLIDALERGRVRHIDIARCNDRSFLIMAGAGVDASIIHRLEGARSWRVGRLAYAGPMLTELIRPRIPRVTMTVDGKTVVDGALGSPIIANSRLYGGHLNIARDASIDEGLLDAVFLPHSTSLGAVAMAGFAWIRRIERAPGVIYQKAREVIVRTEGGMPWQCDGEAVTLEASVAMLTVEPRALPVLSPVQAPPPHRRGRIPPRRQRAPGRTDCHQRCAQARARRSYPA